MSLRWSFEFFYTGCYRYVAPNSPLKIFFFVGDEVTSLNFLQFLKDKLETPYVVSYFFNRLLTAFPCKKSVFIRALRG
jgi:hypothetical protein